MSKKTLLFGRKKKNNDQMTRKELIALMFKIAFLEAMALSLILPSVVSTGEIPATVDQPNELTNIQNGTATVTVTSGTSAGSVTVTFPTTYTSVPKLFVTNHNPLTTTIQVFTPNPEAFFQSSPTTSWTSGMPAIDTEIYGDANGEHRIEVNLANMASFRLGVNCITPSTSLGAYLTIEYLNAGVWTELNSAQRFLIDGTVNGCPNTSNEHFASPTYASIPTVAKISTQLLRIDGVGGGGVGDIPSFASIWMDWSPSATGSNIQTVGLTGQFRVCGTIALCTASPPVESLKTGFVIQVTFPIAVTGTFTEKFTWKAGVIV